MKHIDLYKFVDKDINCRPAICGVFHDEAAQLAVASDARILVTSKSNYAPEHAGKIIDKEGNEITKKTKDGERVPCRYPDYARVIGGLTAKYGYADFPLADLAQAYQNAQNFLKNVPQRWPDGTKVKKSDRSVYLAVHAKDKDGDAYLIGFKYELIQQLMTLPQEGAKATACGSRRAIYWTNEGKGLQAVVMPTMLVPELAREAIETGAANLEENENKIEEYKGMYPYNTIISATISEKTERLFATPEKKERVPMVKCLGEGMGQKAASVHLHPEAELVPVEGFKTFYTRATTDQLGNHERPDLYKLDSGFMVYCGKMPTQPEVYEPVLGKYDPMTYAQMIVANKWNEPMSPRVEYFLKRTGQTIPATC